MWYEMKDFHDANDTENQEFNLRWNILEIFSWDGRESVIFSETQTEADMESRRGRTFRAS